MNKKTLNNVLVLVIIIFSLVASIYGFFSDKIVFENKTFESINGEIITLYGKGLYFNDSVSMVPQARAQDIVTLIIGIPLLIISLILSNKNSLRGKLLLTGTVGYFLYTYASYSFLVTYNQFFLLYVSLMSLSFFSFVMNITSEEFKDLQMHFSPKFPKKYIGISSILIGLFICTLWLGLIIPTIGKIPPVLEHYTTLVIQALDLGFIFPAAIIAGILLIKNNSLGYLLSSVIMIKGATLVTAVSMMAIFMILSGVYVSTVELIMFPLIALICILNLFLIIRNVEQRKRQTVA